MTRILLINPNTSQATTDMMVAIAQAAAAHGIEIIGATARRGVPMILDAAALTAAAAEVVQIGIRHAGDVAGIIISAFGDPGLNCLRRKLDIPVVGIAEAAMIEAAANARRFGVATVTPDLADPIKARAVALGLGPLYTGIQLTEGDPKALADDPDRLVTALADAVTRCIQRDGAEAVAIGGGPLGNAATTLSKRFGIPVIAPIPAAMRRLMAHLQNLTKKVGAPQISQAGVPPLDRSPR
jgi:Asp/Glu/hydantoin racemase